MRKAMIAGNWKMHCTPEEGGKLARAILTEIRDNRVDVVLAPPFVTIPAVANVIQGSSMLLAAQNVASEEKGAFTGEVSVLMLCAIGVTTVIIGHSERRQIFLETDALINKKTLLSLQHGLQVILCIGETLEQREQGQALSVCQRQLQLGLAGISATAMSKVVIAYEPVWAIGTGRSASSADAEEVHSGCRKYLEELYNPQVAAATRILYGGSVKPDNISQLMAMTNIDGALVGGAALNAASFISLINYRK